MRINKPVLTKFQNIYETTAYNGTKNYIARFKHLNKRYPEKNLTHLFGCQTAKQAFDKLQEIKSFLSKGEKPFEQEEKILMNDYFDLYVKNIGGNDKYIKTKYYEKHIQPFIGNKDIKEIEEKHIIQILNSSTLKDLSSRSKFTTKMILDPIFKKSIKKSIRTSNPLEDIKFSKITEKKPLSSRLVSDEKNVVKELYKAFLSQKNIMYKIILLIALMTARRRGEILKLKWEDIEEDKVYVSKDTTKTKIDDEYPLPDEILELLKQLPYPHTGYVFQIDSSTFSKIFRKIVKNSSIKFVRNETITLHDTRHLFMSMMTMETRNSDLVDKCISHGKRGSIKDTYLSFNYKNRKTVFEDYWKILRNY